MLCFLPLVAVGLVSLILVLYLLWPPPAFSNKSQSGTHPPPPRATLLSLFSSTPSRGRVRRNVCTSHSVSATHRDLRPLEIASHLEPPAQNVVVLCKVGVRLFPVPLVSERLPGIATRYPISRDIPHRLQRCADRHCSFCGPQVVYLLE